MKYIVSPSAGLRGPFYKMAYDYRDCGDRRYYKDVIGDGFDFGEYVSRLHDAALGVGLKKGLVPYDTYWLMDEKEDTIYGVSRLRHMLNPVSHKEGGHIGYDVPPSLRNAGNATELLRQTIIKARSKGIYRVLLTCDADNAASARVIEKNGGALENQVISSFTNKLVNRYWICC